MIMINSNGGAAGRQEMIVGSNGGNLKKGPWSASEDAVLIDYVRKHGEGNWNAVQRYTGLLRCGKSCRLRWANHLRPNLKKGAFSSDEERLIIDLHSKLGNKWARISAHLPGRTDNEIKNYWNTRVKRRIRQGLPLYPNDHSLPPPPPPLLPLSLPKTPPPPPPPPTLSLFNSVSLPTPLFSLHHHHHPPAFFSQNHPLKRCTQNSFMGGPTFSPSQMGSFRIGFGPDPGDKMGLDGFGFGCPSFNELPSNQYNQNVDCSNFMEDEVKMNVNVNVNVNANSGRVNSGLLDDLLQEAQVKVGLKREREEDYCSLQWDVPSSENSYTGIKDQSEENELNFDSQEITNIIELIPSLVQVPTWCTDGGAESSAAQSSAVSIDDNCNAIDDRMPEPPSFAAANTTDYDADGDWNPGCYSWDNLPRIC